jgi:hypothetical protein
MHSENESRIRTSKLPALGTCKRGGSFASASLTGGHRQLWNLRQDRVLNHLISSKQRFAVFHIEKALTRGGHRKASHG